MYILLFLFWLLLNGKLTAEVVGLGLVITVLMGALGWGLFGYSPARELRLMRKAPVFCAYIPVLFWEIIKAGLVVARDILFRRYVVTPTLVTFRTDLKTDFGRFLLANSITLTPGTITVQVEGDKLTVHCLDKSMLDTSPDGTFQRWIRKMEAK
ncbi:MAG: Na+/H+ antiporter subunit E [Faecousia sp.]